MAKALASQRSTVTLTSDSKSRNKEAVLLCLTRLNDKATLKVAAEELSSIIRSLDPDGLASVVHSICSTGGWEPKPHAKKECVKALGQLALRECPVAEEALAQPYLGKVLAHLKKTLQDSDSQVREAACEALSSYAWSLAEAAGAHLAGTSNRSSPVVQLIFELLAEQKKEAQLGGSQALLWIAPCIGPLDGELVKLILRLLRSQSFQGTAALLSAIASIKADDHKPVGLLKSGPSAFMPYLKHVIGQAAPRRSSSSSNPDAAATAPKEGGFLGCLSNSSDWAVRRAAADAIRAAVLLLGPQMEPHGCWQLGDPGSLTHKCLSELEDRKFDKVKEAREAIREAIVVLQHLHAFVSSVGPDGDWTAWVNAHMPNAGCLTPTPSGMPGAYSPARPSSADPSQRRTAALRTSPVSKKFQMAAVESDVIADPYSPKAAAGPAEQPDDRASEAETILLAATAPAAEGSSDSVTVETSEQQEQQLVGDGDDVPQALVAEESAAAPEVTSPTQAEQHQPPQQQLRRQWSQNSAGGSRAAGSHRPSSAVGSRPGSVPGSRRATADQQQQSLRRQGSNASAAVADDAATDASIIAAARNRTSSNGGANVRQSRSSANGSNTGSRPRSSQAGSAAAGKAPSWTGPSQEEWQQMQQQLADCQQELLQSRQRYAEQQLQQEQAMAAAVQQMREQYSSLIDVLQERVSTLEQQQQHFQQQAQPGTNAVTQTSSAGQSLSAPAVSGSPSRLSYVQHRGSAGAPGLAPASSTAATPASSEGGASAAAAMRRRSRSMSGAGAAERERMYKSEDWTTPTSSSARRPGLSVLDTLSAGHKSTSGANTPTSTSGTGFRDSPAPTPGRVDAAFVELLHSDKADMQLMRLIQKTGIAWHLLPADTCQELLSFFIRKIEEGVMLHRVVPWLWRLADEDATGRPDVPVDMQDRLLEALRLCPAAEELQVQEKMPLLVQTLEMCWQRRS